MTWLCSLPAWVIFPLFAAATLLFTVAVDGILRRRLVPDDVRAKASPSAATTLQALATIYAVLAAFVVVDEYGQLRDAPSADPRRPRRRVVHDAGARRGAGLPVPRLHPYRHRTDDRVHQQPSGALSGARVSDRRGSSGSSGSASDLADPGTSNPSSRFRTRARPGSSSEETRSGQSSSRGRSRSAGWRRSITRASDVRPNQRRRTPPCCGSANPTAPTSSCLRDGPRCHLAGQPARASIPTRTPQDEG